MGQDELFAWVVEAGELGGVGGCDAAVGEELEDGLGEVGDGAEVGDVTAAETGTAGYFAGGNGTIVCRSGGGNADETDGFLVGPEWLACEGLGDARFHRG